MDIADKNRRKLIMSEHVSDFTQTTFEEETKSGVALVDFWAAWCGPCRMQTPQLEQAAQQLGTQAKTGKVNVDEQPALAARFGVMSIPTIVILKDGKPVKQFVGVTPAATLVEAVKAVL
jgi:thioredoxin 1